MSRFVRNPRFLAEIGVMVRPVLHAAGHAVAEKATAHAHSAMPRRGSPTIEVSEIEDGVRVANTNWGGVIEEFGSTNSPPYAPIRTGVTEAGLKLRES